MSDRRALRRTLTLGAAYDLLLGLFIVLFGQRMLEMLGSPVAPPGYHFLLSSLPLFILCVLYGTAARSPHLDAFRVPVLFARFGGGLFLLGLTAFLRPGADWIYHAIGAGDLAWGFLHLALWRRP